MNRRHKVMTLLAGILLVALAGCSSFSDVAHDDYGVQPDTSYGVLVGSTQTSVEGHGSFFLFAGSMSLVSQSNLRIGFTNDAGNSYALDVPLSKIVFHAQSADVTPSAQFSFSDEHGRTSLAGTLQQVVDYGLVQLNVTITPDQWKQLITG